MGLAWSLFLAGACTHGVAGMNLGSKHSGVSETCNLFDDAVYGIVGPLEFNRAQLLWRTESENDCLERQ